MTEILILYLLLKGQNTMYGLSKSVKKLFGVITNPGFGTIQPALRRLEKNGYVKSDKYMTDGGKPYYYYNINENGKDFLKTQLLANIADNPVKLIPSVKIRLMCQDILDIQKQKELCRIIKTELLKVLNLSEKAQKGGYFDDNFSAKMVLDNTICEYKNLLNLVEGIEKCLQ